MFVRLEVLDTFVFLCNSVNDYIACSAAASRERGTATRLGTILWLPRSRTRSRGDISGTSATGGLSETISMMKCKKESISKPHKVQWNFFCVMVSNFLFALGLVGVDGCQK